MQDIAHMYNCHFENSQHEFCDFCQQFYFPLKENNEIKHNYEMNCLLAEVVAYLFSIGTRGQCKKP